MVNVFHELTTKDDVDFQDYITQLNIIHIFEPIFEEYQDKALCKNIIRFIVYAYSMNSNKISVGGDRRSEKNAIRKNLGIEDCYYEDLVILKSSAVVKSVQRWMDFQDNRQFQYLMTLQEAYVQQQHASLSELKKTDGVTIDYDQKFKCVEYISELRKMIKEAEAELQQNDNKLKEAFSEVQKASKNTTKLSPESFAI